MLDYLVTLRRRELGVRMALGADRTLIMRMILREGVARLAVGVVLGVILTWFAARALQPLLYHVSPRDPLVIVAAILALLACGVVAAFLPRVGPCGWIRRMRSVRSDTARLSAEDPEFRTIP